MRMNLMCLPVVIAVCLFGAPDHVTAEQVLPEKVDFNRHIRPILSENCFACHGNDEKHREAGLRLDQRDAAVKENDGVAADRLRV